MLVHPDALETRVGLLARLLGVDRRGAARALLQEEHLLVVNIGQLTERWVVHRAWMEVSGQWLAQRWVVRRS
jgi:hypothetical protein